MGPTDGISDTEWPLSTDYDANIMCEACDARGILLSPFTEPQAWQFTVTQLLTLIAEHRRICRKRSDAR